MAEFDLRIIIAVIGLLIVVTVLASHVLGRVFYRVIPPALLTCILAEIFTLGSGFLYALFAGTTVLIHHVWAAFISGYGVACVSIFTMKLIDEIHRWRMEKRWENMTESLKK